MDNSAAERALRTVAVGRKNYFSLARMLVESVLRPSTACSVRRSSTDSTPNSTCACARTHRQPSSEPAPGPPALEPHRRPSGSSRSSLSVHQANTWTLNSPSEISIAPSQASSRRYISDAYGQQRRSGSGVGSSRSWNVGTDFDDKVVLLSRPISYPRPVLAAAVLRLGAYISGGKHGGSGALCAPPQLPPTSGETRLST
jgi:hypothetical protein